MAEETPVGAVLEPTAPVPEPPAEPTPETDHPAPYDWRNDIHPDVKNDKVWESVKDVKSLTKAYADATRYNVGAVKIPAPDAPPEAWNAFYEKLGRPADSTAYTLSEEAQANPIMTGMREVAHQAGLTPSQWEKLRDGYNSGIEAQNAAHQERHRAAVADLKAAWGGAYEQNVSRIERTIKQLGGDEALASVVDRGLGNDVPFIKMMHTVAKVLRDEKIVTGDLPGIPTPEATKAEIEKITGSAAYLDGRHPDHESLVARVRTLYELLYT